METKLSLIFTINLHTSKESYLSSTGMPEHIQGLIMLLLQAYLNQKIGKHFSLRNHFLDHCQCTVPVTNQSSPESAHQDHNRGKPNRGRARMKPYCTGDPQEP